jgi:hypothetical protein
MVGQLGKGGAEITIRLGVCEIPAQNSGQSFDSIANICYYKNHHAPRKLTTES